MTHQTRHPVADPPAAPERETTGHLLLRAYAVLVIFSALAHSFWYDLVGLAGTEALLGAITVATIAAWVPRMRTRRRAAPLAWRRLPWLALAYVALALASLLWSQWPATTAITWFLLASTTLQGLFLADVLTWRELLHCLELALRWVMGLSLALELWVATVRRAPLLPNFSEAPDDPDPQWFWIRGNLFDGLFGGARIQGAVGNANLLGILCVLALIVFAVQIADRASGRVARIAWTVLAGYLLVRAGSATSFVALAGAIAVLAAALLMRGTRRPGERTRLYVLFTAVGAAAVAVVLLLGERVLALVGRGDLTGREAIWGAVLDRALERPVAGSGFASPWMPWDPAFDGWIRDHGITVFHAHNMWLDVLLQLGGIGVVVAAGVFGALTWRAWFFAVDRPRWDLDATRPYQAASLAPLLIVAILLVQGLTESGPVMLWGWMLVVALSWRIKSAPLIGVGAAEGPPPARRDARPRRT